MKALNVPVHDTPVGLMACLPPGWTAFAGIGARQDGAPHGEIDLGDVLGVVTKAYAKTWADACEWCKGYEHAERCTCGYAPLTFVKVLDVRPIVSYGEWEIGGPREACVTVDDYGNAVWMDARGGEDDAWGVLLDLPDAEPGGVALHVEWTDCPTCGGDGIDHGLYFGDDRPCPTCQTPHPVENDGPIVEVTT